VQVWITTSLLAQVLVNTTAKSTSSKRCVSLPALSYIKLTLQTNAPEKPDLKLKLLAEIDEKARKNIVIASSSSGIPSSKFVGQCKNPERVLIGHPFNPPHLMPLVEVVPHPGTCNTAIATALQFYNSLGRKAINIKEETPGFVANRLQAALCNEAYSLVSRGIVSAQELGKTVHTSPRYPEGSLIR